MGPWSARCSILKRFGFKSRTANSVSFCAAPFHFSLDLCLAWGAGELLTGEFVGLASGLCWDPCVRLTCHNICMLARSGTHGPRTAVLVGLARRPWMSHCCIIRTLFLAIAGPSQFDNKFTDAFGLKLISYKLYFRKLFSYFNLVNNVWNQTQFNKIQHYVIIFDLCVLYVLFS